MKKLFLVFIIIGSTIYAAAQGDSTIGSTITLDEVIIRAFNFNRRIIDVPASVVVVDERQLNRFNNTSILPALNINPGIRMEERSPGSYRLNIRGSSLRSPFGVRNVKVYYNGIPYTDPGGNTFLNQLGFINVQSLEIIKGPGSSLYGAGTGGVLLIGSVTNKFRRGIKLSQSVGSYGLNNFSASLRSGDENTNSSFVYQHQKADGYRDHTEMRRDVLTWDGSIKVKSNSSLQAHLLYGDLYYETPGALTRKEFETNPRLSRPPAGPNPSATAAKASIRQQSFLTGFTYSSELSSAVNNSTSIYGAYTLLKNPTIRNYERKTEPHVGGRTIFNYTRSLRGMKLQVSAGAEYQQGFTTVRLSKNKNGESDSLQSDDEINNRNITTFIQLVIDLPKGWSVTGGISYTSQQLSFKRLTSFPVNTLTQEYSNELAPRIALLKKFGSSVSGYVSISRGFSPPTTAELLPSTSVINTTLKPETGTSYELGGRGSLVGGKVHFDLAFFYFKLNNTIVQQRDANGADFFVNAGATNQNGIESSVSWQVIESPAAFINQLNIWSSHTWHNFHYKVPKTTGTDPAARRLPGTPPHTIAAGADLQTSVGAYANVTYNYNDPIPLNQINTDYATSFQLLGARAGLKVEISKKFLLDFFGAAENVFDSRYSLGNDINAAGGRYFNAAAGRNYTAGVIINFLY